MKKIYIAPETNIVLVQHTTMLATSTLNSVSENSNSSVTYGGRTIESGHSFNVKMNSVWDDDWSN